MTAVIDIGIGQYMLSNLHSTVNASSCTVMDMVAQRFVAKLTLTPALSKPEVQDAVLNHKIQGAYLIHVMHLWL